MTGPCYKCGMRRTGCHSSCSAYALYREIVDRRLADNRRKSMLDSHIVEAKKKFKCRY